MATALGLAARGLGQVWPNPAVGCVLVRGGRVVGRGWTQPGGRPHAETEALRRAGPAARGATAYVTLEPCAHHGRTEPCADALATAGVSRAVVAMEDPDPRVGGRGLERLRAGGVSVVTGVCAEKARDLNAGFLSRTTRNRPLVTLKIATSLDGRIATHSGASRWITGPEARARAHRLRASHDAVLVGVGTVLADDPELDCRLPGLDDRSPARVVLDGRLRTPLTSRLVRTARRSPTWVVVSPDADAQRRRVYRENGVELIEVAKDTAGYPDLGRGLQALADRGVTRLLVEGGGQIAASFLRAGLVDRLAWFRAPKIIGGDGVPAVAGFGLDDLSKAPLFAPRAAAAMGDDLLESLVREK